MLHLHRAFPRLCCIILDPDLDLNLDPLSFIIFSTFCFTTNDALLYFYECRISGLVFVLFVCFLHSFTDHDACLTMGWVVAYSPWGPPFSFPLLFTCRVSLSSSPSNLHQTKLYAVFVSTCLSSQTIPVWVIDDDHSLSPDTPPCWDKHCKHGLLSCTIFCFIFFLHSVGFGFGLLLLRRILLRLITIKAGLTLSSHFVWIHVLVTSFHIRSRHTYRQIQTRRWFLLLRRLLYRLFFAPGYVLLLH